MSLIVFVLASMVAATSAECDICVNGWCHIKKTLLLGFEDSDIMAIDQVNNILYLQITSTPNPILLAEDVKIQMIETKNMTVMAVDPISQVLYLGDNRNKLYKYEKDNLINESNMSLPIEVEKILFQNGNLHYLTKVFHDNVMLYARIPLWYHIHDYSITDFTVDKEENIYFIANDTVYVMNQYNFGRPKPLMWGVKNFTLSTDNFGDVYIGDATLNAIYKIVNETDKAVLYAAYQNGTLTEFIFDHNNNILFHDADEGTLNMWQSISTRCHVGKLHAVPEINVVSDNAKTVNYDTSPA